MIFDQTRKDELSSYGEAVRLSNELRSKVARTIIDEFGNRVDYPAVRGFNPDTADYTEFASWLNDITKKKSQSLFWFVIRVMCVRFPEKHTEIRLNLSERRRLEFDLILSNMKNEVEWIGTVGYQNMVMLDGTLNNTKTRTTKLNDDEYKTVRI